jgi:hypothetical protein
VGNYVLAAADMDVALSLAENAPDNFLSKLYMEAGLIYSYSAQTSTDRVHALSYFDKALPLIGAGSNLPDPYHMKADQGVYFTLRAQALTAPHMSMQGDALTMLDQAESFIQPQLQRRRLIADIFRSQALVNSRDYEEATTYALSSLRQAATLRSTFNKSRIEDIYDQLGETNFKGHPLLARLGVALAMWTPDA